MYINSGESFDCQTYLVHVVVVCRRDYVLFLYCYHSWNHSVGTLACFSHTPVNSCNVDQNFHFDYFHNRIQ